MSDQEPPYFGDEVESFQSWLQDNEEYYRGGDSAATVKFLFESASDNTRIERTFDRNSGDLHVHHDYFKVDQTSTTPGFSKKLFRGLMEVYEQIGVDRITTYADIDIGAYAWGRYGFAPESSGGYRSIQSLAQATFGSKKAGDVLSYDDEVLVRGADGQQTRKTMPVTAALTEAQLNGVRMLASRLRDNEPASFWHLLDARVPGHIEGTDTKVSFSIGKLLMIDHGWNAEFDMSNTTQVNRWKAYLGKRRG